MDCTPVHEALNEAEAQAGLSDKLFGRTVCADVVAMDQMLVYNRFGTFNPFGMMYALRRDVVGLAWRLRPRPPMPATRCWARKAQAARSRPARCG